MSKRRKSAALLWRKSTLAKSIKKNKPEEEFVQVKKENPYLNK
jgi:ribosomal protein L39E